MKLNTASFFFFMAVGVAVFVGLTYGVVPMGNTITFSLVSLIIGLMAGAYAITDVIIATSKKS